MKQKQENLFGKSVFEDLLSGVGCSGLTIDSVVLALWSFASQAERPVFVSTKNPEEAFDLYSKGLEHDKSMFTYFPDNNNNNNVPGFEKEDFRYQKESFIKAVGGGAFVCVGTTSSFKEKTIPKEQKTSLKKKVFSVGARSQREGLTQFLDKLGYEKVDVVEALNEYSFRGDVVDFFPTHFSNPVRISFCFNETESICIFDPMTQLPTRALKKIVLKEVFEPQVVDNISFIDRFPGAFLLTCRFEKDGFVLFSGETKKYNNFSFSVFSLPRDFNHKNKVSTGLFLKNFKNVFFVAKKGGVPGFLSGFSVKIICGSIESGFWSKKESVLVLSDNDFSGGYSQKTRWQPSRSKTQVEITTKNLSHLKRGDLVVHESFGVGLYGGPIEKTYKMGVKEGVEIEYKDNTKVFVSMEHVGLVHRYIGSGKKPGLSKIGSKKWENEVKKARESAKEIAYEIFTLYSKKSAKRDFKYEKENDLGGLLSSSFSFVETQDQKKAFADVFNDMNRSTPMDRLISGDVGFGKTEVAIRAMFKAFLSSRLSVLLCPTTILADQHFITCKERLSQFDVSISLLSRFKTKKEQKETLLQLKNNQINVLIGTHRILSKDVVMQNLGLLIIDEEHRFGVNHKEKIRSLKNNIDVLTLTATPIPRTLQQSLVGLRKLTTIKTPPTSRKPIKTFVKFFSWNLVFSHIQKETNRKGQVYFLNNDIKSIPFVVKKIKDRFNDKTVVGASAKMDSKTLEETVLAFFDGLIDILVCTTIIESGLDVTNANTMIVNNAQNFGLAQLYQIRGRVGRGNKQASCLLLIPPGKKLDKDSFNRLKAIEQNTALGSGHNISQKDMEIRGAGSLFGYKQSGHISTVGFEMYCELLKQQINLRKEPTKDKEVPVFVVNEKAEIPPSYIKKEQIRIDYYYQISKASKEKEIGLIKKNLIKGFGTLPKETKTLLNSARIKVLLTGSLIKKIEASNNRIDLIFNKPKKDFDVVAFFKSVQKFKHKKLLNYKYKNNQEFDLEIKLNVVEFFPSMDLLFSFLKFIKNYI